MSLSLLLASAAPSSWAMGRKPVPGECAGFDKGDFKLLLELLDDDTPHRIGWRKLEKKALAAARDCAPRLAAEPKLAGCLDPLVGFVSNQRLTHERGHAMGFRLADADYLANEPKEMISFPSELSDGLPGDWKALCRRKGWDCVEFVSKSLPNPPHFSFKRLLIRATGERFDRWMLFTLPRKGTAERLVDFMGVEHSSLDAGTGELTKLGRPRLHLVEYWRNAKGRKPVYRSNIAACYKCHPSGMRDIVPAHGSTDAEGQRTVEKLNAWIHANGPFDWGRNAIIPELYGPPMGAKQSCTSCHDGQYRGVIDAAHLGERSRHQLYFKMTQDLSMPPGKARRAEYKPLFDALAKAELLDGRERSKLFQPTPVPAAADSVALGLGGSKGPMAVSNRRLLRFLDRKGLITGAERDVAERLLRSLEAESTDDYAAMMKEYRRELVAWLKGGRPECAALFGK